MSSTSTTSSPHAANGRRVTAGTTGLDLYGDDRSVVAVRVNGEPRDLHLPFSEGDEIEPISISSDEGLAILRHSTAHVLAQAAEAKLGIGPPITDGSTTTSTSPSRIASARSTTADAPPHPE